MPARKILPIIIMFCGLVFSTTLVRGQSGDSLPIITAENAAQLAPMTTLESSYLGEMAWSDDGKWLALGTGQDGVQVFKADDLTTAPLHLAGGTDVLFHPTSKQLASAGSIWDIETQQALFTFGNVDYQQFSPDGRYLLTAKRASDHTDFTLWDIPSGEAIDTFTVDTINYFRDVVFSGDSNRYALIFRADETDQSNSFIQVRATSSTTSLATFDADYAYLVNVTFSNKGQYLVAYNLGHSVYGSGPAEVIIWDIASQSRLREFDTNDWITTTLSFDSKWMFLPGYAQQLIIALDSGQSMVLDLDQSETSIWAEEAVFSPDGRYIGIRYDRFRGEIAIPGIAIWHTEPMADLSFSLAKFTEENFLEFGEVSDFAFSPDSNLVAAAFEEATILWDIESSSIQQTIEDSGQLRFTSDGLYLLVSDENSERTWDIDEGKLVNQIAPNEGLRSPGGRLIANRSPDTLSIMDVVSGEETTPLILDDYLGRVTALDAVNSLVVFSDEILHVYNLDNDKQLLQLDSVPAGFTFSPDGNVLIAWDRSEIPESEMLITAYHMSERGIKTVLLEGTLKTSPLGGVLNPSQSDNVVASPDGQYIVASEIDSAADTSHLYLYDAGTGRRLAEWREESAPRYINMSVFSPDSRYLLTARSVEKETRYNKEVIIDIWEVPKLLAEPGAAPIVSLTLNARDIPISLDMSFTPDVNNLVVSMDDAFAGDFVQHGYRATIFDWLEILTKGGELNEHDLKSVILENAYSPVFSTRDSIVVTGNTLTIPFVRHIFYVDLWDSVTGEQLISLEGFRKGVLSPDGSLLIALSEYEQMMLWHMETLLQGDQTPLITLDSPGVEHIAFSPNGDRIYQQTVYGITTLAVNP